VEGYQDEKSKQCRQTDREKGNITTNGIGTQTKQPLEYEVSKPSEK